MTRAQLTALPKAELHIHLEGALDLAFLTETARRKGLDPPPDDFYAFADFGQFLAAFIGLRPFLAEEADFRPAARYFARRLAGDGTVYAEALFMPFSHLVRGMDYQRLVAEIDAGLAQAEAEGGPKVKLLASIPRHFRDEAAPMTLDLLARHPHARVIGIDLSGTETPESIAPLAEYFERARDLGLRTVAHAGEFGPADNVRRTIDLLRPERLGHGLSAANDPALMADLARLGVTVDISPSSNVQLKAVTGWADHPARRLHQAGVAITLNTDDPAFFRTDLITEYQLAATELGFQPTELIDLAANSFRHSFLPPEEKQAWLARLAAHRID